MITFWHNPRCSKSRQALALLEEHGAPVDIRLYLANPPSREELETVAHKLGLPPLAMMRTGEKPFEEQELSENDSPDNLFDAMAEFPILIERPIAIRASRAVIGRPPENVLSLLD
ncbi:arsenate reductase (glutaredoxin) [Aliishimia ponticola]|uniref:Arsenate reductase n=1 Tax=Aliishimia ponticola TaxID=2499833 RepID=A0A4S4NCG2_9RHOB|nr:arsenate reductase (glutaredoxin) [Aliishimia ponticola]THH37112.1 arsenate reductase (glutaredoxin) [Aliishimia ponticola]